MHINGRDSRPQSQKYAQGPIKYADGSINLCMEYVNVVLGGFTWFIYHCTPRPKWQDVLTPNLGKFRSREIARYNDYITLGNIKFQF